MYNLMNSQKRKRLKNAEKEISEILNDLRIEGGDLAPTDDSIPLSTALYYLDRAINYDKYNR